MLQKFDHYNDFSPALTKKLTERIAGFSKIVRYKFNISNPDPHPDNRGKVVWPSNYVLDPCSFTIVDHDENRPDKQKIKHVGIVHGRDVEVVGAATRTVYKFTKIRLMGERRGMLEFDTSNPEDVAFIMYLELHPKNKNGVFPDPNKHQVFERIDEYAISSEKRTTRTAKIKALNVAQEMSEKEVVQFADAMLWDSTEDIVLLRNRVEELAETDPVFFNEIVESKQLEYRALIKNAMDKKIVSFDPANYKFTWTSNNQPLAVLAVNQEKNEIEALADYFIGGGEKAAETAKKLKSLVK